MPFVQNEPVRPARPASSPHSRPDSARQHTPPANLAATVRRNIVPQPSAADSIRSRPATHERQSRSRGSRQSTLSSSQNLTMLFHTGQSRSPTPDYRLADRWKSESSPQVNALAPRHDLLPPRHQNTSSSVEINSSANRSSLLRHPLAVSPSRDRQLAVDKRATRSPTPFKRWMHAFKKKSARAKDAPSAEAFSLPSTQSHHFGRIESAPSSSQHSLSFTSSVGLLAAVKSASVNFGSTSAVFSSSRHSCLNEDERIEKEDDAISTHPPSEMSIEIETDVLSHQRWRIVDELLVSEEAYLHDLRAFVNVYITIFANEPAMLEHKRIIQKILLELQELHEDLFVTLDKELQQISSVFDKGSPKTPYLAPEHNENSRARFLRNTAIVKRISEIFIQLAPRFLHSYEAFSAHIALTKNLLAASSEKKESWHSYERGIEALAVPLASIQNKETVMQKSLTLSDLLIKPIQRLCKYVVIFENILALLSKTEDEETHLLMRILLGNFKLILEEVNAAQDDSSCRKSIYAAWILQERLKLPLSSQQTLEDNGRVLLCGVLFISMETSEKVKGMFSIVCLYRNRLVLSTISETDSKSYLPYANIDLRDATLESSENGRGLQCNNSSFSWKLQFRSKGRLHEFLVTAGSEIEEKTWKAFLLDCMTGERAKKWHYIDNKMNMGSEIYCPLQPLHPTKGLLRRLSVYYSNSIPWFKKSGKHVILQNMQSREIVDNAAAGSIRRSISQASHGTVVVLSPQISERIQMESVIGDVWSRQSLPFTGSNSMGLFKSTSSVIRKLSISNIAQSFMRMGLNSTVTGGVIDTIGKDSPSREGMNESQQSVLNRRPKSSLGFVSTSAAGCNGNEAGVRPDSARSLKSTPATLAKSTEQRESHGSILSSEGFEQRLGSWRFQNWLISTREVASVRSTPPKSPERPLPHSRQSLQNFRSKSVPPPKSGSKPGSRRDVARSARETNTNRLRDRGRFSNYHSSNQLTGQWQNDGAAESSLESIDRNEIPDAGHSAITTPLPSRVSSFVVPKHANGADQHRNKTSQSSTNSPKGQNRSLEGTRTGGRLLANEQVVASPAKSKSVPSSVIDALTPKKFRRRVTRPIEQVESAESSRGPREMKRRRSNDQPGASGTGSRRLGSTGGRLGWLRG